MLNNNVSISDKIPTYVNCKSTVINEARRINCVSKIIL